MNLKVLIKIISSVIISYSVTNAETLTIATVNNGDMIRMQKLSSDFIKKNPGIDLKWITLSENILRQRVTTDISTNSGQYDIVTIGTYEVPIWAKKKWLIPLNNLSDNYDIDDILPAIRKGLTLNYNLYAAPFYAESSMIMYRKDLFSNMNLKMPKEPTWNFIVNAAQQITNKEKSINGICLRGKAGWGENMALITSIANSFGAKWFDMDWNPQFNSKEWKDTLTFYINLLKSSGPKDSYLNGFNQNLKLFQEGKCAIWIDATVAASSIIDPKHSIVYDKVDFALAPHNNLGKKANWLWSWNLAIPKSSKKVHAAKKFIEWSTSKTYLKLVAQKEGWANVPPGTRKSLYKNSNYIKSASFAQMTLNSINLADPLNPVVDKVPYIGIQFVSIPEFPNIATKVGQQFSAALQGTISMEHALQNAQKLTKRIMIKEGYIK